MLASQTAKPDQHLQALLAAERPRLVRLCTRLCGNAAAEDLAQETLIEAWCNADKLYDAEGISRWLSAIARNVCLRWLRQQGRDFQRAQASESEQEDWAEGVLADGGDFEVELERDELATFLDHALALLPPFTRDVLVQKYIYDSPHAEIAVRLGLTEGAVTVRVHRGKLALRRLLATDLRPEAATYGLVSEHERCWQETRIWCPICGGRRLMVWVAEDCSEFSLHCPGCSPETETVMLHSFVTASLGGNKTLRPALSRLFAWVDDYYRPGLLAGAASCGTCGRVVPFYRGAPEELPPQPWNADGIYTRCAYCAILHNCSLNALVLALPEGRQFWREHPRIRLLPQRELEVEGQAATVTTFESVTNTARFDVIFSRDVCRVLAIHSTSAMAQ